MINYPCKITTVYNKFIINAPQSTSTFYYLASKHIFHIEIIINHKKSVLDGL